MKYKGFDIEETSDKKIKIYLTADNLDDMIAYIDKHLYPYGCVSNNKIHTMEKD